MGNTQKITDRKRINLYLSRAVVTEMEGLLRDRESVSSVTEDLLQGEIKKRLPWVTGMPSELHAVVAEAQSLRKPKRVTNQPGTDPVAQTSKRKAS